MISVAESFVNVVYWFPFYYTFKFIFLLWLSLPYFRYVVFISAMLSFWASTCSSYWLAELILRGDLFRSVPCWSTTELQANFGVSLSSL